MSKFHLTNKAVEDLEEIWDFTVETWSEKQAEKYYLQFLNSCQELANDPNRGKKYNEIAEEILGFRFYQHIIFYRKIAANEIEVIRILHGRMDLKGKM